MFVCLCVFYVLCPGVINDDDNVSEAYVCGLLYRYFDCEEMHGLFTPVHKLSSAESFVASDTKPSMPSPRITIDYRQQDKPVCTVIVTFK